MPVESDWACSRACGLREKPGERQSVNDLTVGARFAATMNDSVTHQEPASLQPSPQ
jgi:hypothetical protein